MNVRVWILLLAIMLAPLSAHAQGFAGLGAEAGQYTDVRPGHSLRFPRDHGPHPEFRIEWWYLTANLEAADGTPMGLQWTLFRQAMRPNGREDGWQSRQLWMGHAAVTTPDAHHFAERFARGGIGQAGVDQTGVDQARVDQPAFSAWIDDWRLAGEDTLDRLTLSARGDDFDYEVALQAHAPLVLNGAGGFSEKSHAGQASYYYSQPHYQLSGSVTLDGRDVPVTGQAWLDREWSSQPLTEDQTGWDWLSLHLPQGAKLMVYGLRHAGGRDYLTGTYVAPDGSVEALVPGSVLLSPEQITRVKGREIPTAWRVEVPTLAIDLTARALNPQAYMDTVFAYWEGPVSFEGSHAGVGYLEMTGY